MCVWCMFESERMIVVERVPVAEAGALQPVHAAGLPADAGELLRRVGPPVQFEPSALLCLFRSVRARGGVSLQALANCAEAPACLLPAPDRGSTAIGPADCTGTVVRLCTFIGVTSSPC